MSGKYRRYPAYKPTRVEWVGDVPEGWELKPLAVLCDFQQGKAHEPFIDDMGSFICVNARFVSTEGVARKYCTKNLTPAKKDDVLMVMSDLPNGRALAKGYFVKDDGPYAVNQRVCRLTAKRANSKFLFYQLSRNPYFLRFDDGSNQTHLPNAAFTKFPALVPPLPEQAKIAAFLDHETAKIDALIAKQQRLIALLEEKRQAVISHAVTKGLDPTAPLRPSGIDWLGDVPAHWVTSSLKFQTEEMQTGPFGSQLHSGDYISGGTPLVNPAHMVKGAILPDIDVSVDQATVERLHRHKLREGELVLARRGELGRCAIVTSKEVGWLCGTGSLKAALKNTLNPAYAFLLITSKGVTSEMSLESKGSTMENLNTETLGNIRLPVPPLVEQLNILSHVDGLASLYDGLVSRAAAAGTLLKERRTALISAAVTGKIDLRDWQQPEGASNLSTQDIDQTEEAIA